MLKIIPEFSTHAEIDGFRFSEPPDIENLLNAAKETDSAIAAIQFFDADMIATWEHLYFAALDALTAFKNKTNISKTLSVETIVYASGQRQISKATELLGVKPRTKRVAVLILTQRPEALEETIGSILKIHPADLDDSVLDVVSRKKQCRIQKIFGIADAELKTFVADQKSPRNLVDLVIERMALVATRQ